MIVTLTPRSSARFPATALPEHCQGPALQHLISPQVASWSMYPTLCKGDRLELGPAEALHAGDLVVFRKPAGLVCHRLVARQDNLLLTKGDASSGPPEHVRIDDVLGIVVAVVRGSTRAIVADLTTLAPPPPWARLLDRVTITLHEQIRWFAWQFVRSVLLHPRIGTFVARQITRCATIERFGSSPVHSLNALEPSSGQGPPLHLPPLLDIRFGPFYLGIFNQ
ncbi:MAG: S24/S26 family peptidase, partial [Nitrospira sp.]